MQNTFLKQTQSHTSLKTLAVVLLFLAAQVLGIFHLVEHSISGHNDGCNVCDTVAHSGTFTLPEPIHLPLPPEPVQQSIHTSFSHLYEAHLAVYSSRAPPFYS
ncbi:MAG TPA: hypothetical protein VFT64_08600 [Rickettsiales bacterium]|nr:hypothetical protein [Rickettsiales bacterium]